MRFDKVLEWLGSSLTNQLLVGGIAVLILLAVWLGIRRRRTKETRAVKPVGDAPASKDDLREVFEAYRMSHPSFYSIMAAIQENRKLDDFMSNTEFAGAVAKLRLWQAARKALRTEKNSKPGVLRIEAVKAGESSNEVRAAMITILRILYASPEVSGNLAARAEVEMDRLLESLTG